MITLDEFKTKELKERIHRIKTILKNLKTENPNNVWYCIGQIQSNINLIDILINPDERREG